mmetsp:Transcript_11814/g.20919  ORF Transcript_11814/g.20919 Transcript_11814/m.20919 type:complete len:244 (+) Transcript_11814:61-792(+)
MTTILAFEASGEELETATGDSEVKTASISETSSKGLAEPWGEPCSETDLFAAGLSNEISGALAAEATVSFVCIASTATAAFVAAVALFLSCRVIVAGVVSAVAATSSSVTVVCVFCFVAATLTACSVASAPADFVSVGCAFGFADVAVDVAVSVVFSNFCSAADAFFAALAVASVFATEAGAMRALVCTFSGGSSLLPAILDLKDLDMASSSASSAGPASEVGLTSFWTFAVFTEGSKLAQYS